MKKSEQETTYWSICQECLGQGKKSRRLRKKLRIHYQLEVDQFEKEKGEGDAPIRPKSHQDPCADCKGSGLIQTEFPIKLEKNNYPHLAIIGGGIGGVALAVACLHRGIPFTLFEKDSHFEARSQGYGLTLQQASNAIKGLGLLSLNQGVHSTRHVVHTTEGKVIVEWGMRMRQSSDFKASPKRTNIHIARQTLRLALLEQLEGTNEIKWGHQLINFKKDKDGRMDLTFQTNGNTIHAKADLVVGADGIRSSVRKQLIGEDSSPLRYLGCIVILGICPLAALNGINNPLLDSATVFQTVNGNERIYMMPFSEDTIMWQLSFPMPEKEAIALHLLGTKALKEEACRRTKWHDPIPQIMEATLEAQITGYPVYDRALLKPEGLENAENATLIGDAAHPMSPFKGQGANQALLDALALARGISKGCNPLSKWKESGLRKNVLTAFETEMLERSASKVIDSAEAVQHLHSNLVLREGDEKKIRSLKK